MKLWVRMGVCASVMVVGALGICAGQSQQDQPSQDKPQEQASPDQSPQAQSPQDQSRQTQQPSEPAAPASPDTAQPGAEPQTKPPAENKTTEPQTAPPLAPEAPVLKRRPAHKPVHKKKTTKTQSGKVVVRNGGAKEGTPELAPGTSKEQQIHKRENTNQLLATTDANLKSVAGRQLTPAQQSMMEQIRTYMSQAKTAADSGDLDRAHTLAYKAHLLSDELAKK